MNNKVNKFHPFFLIQCLALKHMEEDDFFIIEFLDTILFLKTIENYFKNKTKHAPMNLNNLLSISYFRSNEFCKVP